MTNIIDWWELALTRHNGEHGSDNRAIVLAQIAGDGDNFRDQHQEQTAKDHRRCFAYITYTNTDQT